MFRIFDSISFAIERLWQHRVLVIWALVGLIAATTLALSLPLYVDAVNSNLLASRLTQPPRRLVHRRPARGDAKAAEEIDAELRSR